MDLLTLADIAPPTVTERVTELASEGNVGVLVGLAVIGLGIIVIAAVLVRGRGASK